MMKQHEHWILLMCCVMVVRCMGEYPYEDLAQPHSSFEQGLTEYDVQIPPIPRDSDGGILEAVEYVEGDERPSFNPEYLCPHPIFEADVRAAAPYIITKPGDYCLVEDIYVGNLGGARSTIVIDADDVTLSFWGHSIIVETEIGVQIEAGRGRITINGGQIFGTYITPHHAPYSGIFGAGTPSQPISDVTVRDMVFNDLFHGVVMEHATSSFVTESEFTYCEHACLEWIGGGQDSSVTNSVFDLPKYPSRVNDGVHAVCASELLIEGNMFFNSGYFSDPFYEGMPLYPGGRGVSVHCTPSDELEEGHDVVVRNNDFYRLEVGVRVMESTEDTLIERNTFYGGMPPVMRDFCPMHPGIGQALWLIDAVNVTIVGNQIFSGPDASWWAGIDISGSSTISGQGTKSPGIYGNQMCGVDEPLLLPPGVSRSDVDGGNVFDACGPCRLRAHPGR